MINKTLFCVALFIMSILLPCGLNRKQVDIDRASNDNSPLTAFSDFSFMGSGMARYRENGLVDTSYLAQHSESEQRLPSKLVKGEQYIYHRLPSQESTSLALETFPDRLAKLGFKLITPPNSILTMHLYDGGPLFTIYFTDGSREFAIYNTLHWSQESPWDGHAYILVYVR